MVGETLPLSMARREPGGVARVPPGPSRASQGRPEGFDSAPRGADREVDRCSTERSSVMARERYGNGYKGRAGSRRRMRARNVGYVGSSKTAGHAKGHMAHDW